MLEPTVSLFSPPAALLDPVLERIALCESGNDPLAKNPDSTASGHFQFIRGSWEWYGRQAWGSLEGRDMFDWHDNTELAYWVAQRYGYAPSGASRTCWARTQD